jgi:hypothetical protein
VAPTRLPRSAPAAKQVAKNPWRKIIFPPELTLLSFEDHIQKPDRRNDARKPDVAGSG